MTSLWGNEADELPPPGRLRLVLSWLAVPIACLVGFVLLVIPALLWGYNGITDLRGVRGPETPRGLFLMTLAVLPTGVALLIWFLTRSLPLRRERFTLAVLVASAVGFVTLLPLAGYSS